jgi:predicted DCC family thiol-disulfide oxidoreductase YuxK
VRPFFIWKSISVNTEITDINARTGLIFYDGECALCAGWARRFERELRAAGFGLATLPNRQAGAAVAEMVVLTPEGRRFGGADAIVQIARRLWWAWPLFALAHAPGAMPALHAAYRRLAANRHCLGGACRVTRSHHVADWLPLFLLPSATLLLRDAVPAWVFMWLLAFAVFFGCKWLTWRRACRKMGSVSKFASFGYLFAWVGMDAKSFLPGAGGSFPPAQRDWLIAVSRTVFGAALLWIAARQAPGANPLVAGWLGMVGIILCLHFGLFHLVALVWQHAGFHAQPLMRAPLRATSLADFWGGRWNAAFHLLAHDLTFRPLVRRCGVAGATLIVFLISGLVHDLVISLPARGGYGLPTGYFVLQGLAVLFERSAVGRAFGLGRGWRGWFFMIVVTAAPAYWLFHPVFIHNVILPMLRNIGAI